MDKGEGAGNRQRRGGWEWAKERELGMGTEARP